MPSADAQRTNKRKYRKSLYDLSIGVFADNLEFRGGDRTGKPENFPVGSYSNKCVVGELALRLL